MKTSLEISDELFRKAKARAREDRTTLRNLVERGLRQILAAGRKAEKFRLRDASFRGNGLSDEGELDWADIRDKIYKGRGA